MEKQLYSNGAPNTVWQEYERYLGGVREQLALLREGLSEEASPPRKFDPDDIAALLETHLDSTSIWIDGRVSKVKHLIAAAGDLSIHVYPNDHAPAHFHVISKQRGIDVRFSLDILEPINVKKGSLSSRDAKKIKNFFDVYPGKLAQLRTEYARMQH